MINREKNLFLDFGKMVTGFMLWIIHTCSFTKSKISFLSRSFSPKDTVRGMWLILCHIVSRSINLKYSLLKWVLLVFCNLLNVNWDHAWFYRASHVLVDLGWVDFDFCVPPSCPAASAQFPSAQAESGRQLNTQNISQQNPVY